MQRQIEVAVLPDAPLGALTEEAARSVGIGRLTLLEEPQAALYAWVAQMGDAWRKQVKLGELILVTVLVDIVRRRRQERM